MEGPISFWGYKEQESNLILPKHDDDDDLFFTGLQSLNNILTTPDTGSYTESTKFSLQPLTPFFKNQLHCDLNIDPQNSLMCSNFATVIL